MTAPHEVKAGGFVFNALKCAKVGIQQPVIISLGQKQLNDSK
jgi:hypothetical protein